MQKHIDVDARVLRNVKLVEFVKLGHAQQNPRIEFGIALLFVNVNDQ